MTPRNQQCPAVPQAHAPSRTDRRRRRRAQRTLLGGLQKAAVLGAIAILPVPVVAGTANAQAAHPTSQVRTVSQDVVLVNSYQDISNLHYRFIELLDARDNAGMAALFAHGTFELNFGGTFAATGEEAVFALLQRLFPTKPTAEAWSRHYVTNLIIETDDALGTATDRLYSSAWGVRAGKPSHFVGMGRHVGNFELIDGEWVFKKLVIYADVNYPYPADEPPPPTFEEVVDAIFTAIAEKVGEFVTAVSDVFSSVVTTAVRLVKAVLTALFNPGQEAQTAATLKVAADNDDSGIAAASIVDGTATESDDAATNGEVATDDAAPTDKTTDDDIDDTAGVEESEQVPDTTAATATETAGDSDLSSDEQSSSDTVTDGSEADEADADSSTDAVATDSDEPTSDGSDSDDSGSGESDSDNSDSSGGGSGGGDSSGDTD